jgi:hypothetical protein
MTDPYFDKVSLLLSMKGDNGGTEFIDWSPSSKELTIEGNVCTVTNESKYYGSSGYFDGVGDYLRCDKVADELANQPAFTMEAWVHRLSGASGQEAIFSIHDSSGLNIIIFTLTNIFGSSFSTRSFSPPPVGLWNHVAFVRDVSAIRVYFNGVLLIEENATVNNVLSSHLFTIGQEYDSSPLTATDFFKGYMNDVRVTKTARYTTNFTPPDRLFSQISNTNTTPILDENSQPAIRRIHAIPRVNAPQRIQSTISDSSGRYSIWVPSIEHNVIILDDEEGEPYNDIMISRVIPG